MSYYRPIVRRGRARPEGALPLAGGPAWFAEAECLSRGAAPRLVPAADLPEGWRAALTAPRAPLAGLAMDRARIMGILNVTPDSFSDGGAHIEPDTAVAAARAMAEAGAGIIDVGGESTRPGATEVPEAEEIARIAPVIGPVAALGAPVSIDTRKAGVARAALEAGAAVVNDVSALTFDPRLADVCATTGAPVILMHAQGTPETMQDDPRYDDVLLDVFDALEGHLARAEAAGIPRARCVVDPGIGFGKTLAHNLALIRGIALFHGLGVPVMLGASRKGFIGQVSGAPGGAARAPGSVAVALRAAAEGVQLLRVHDVAETAQALALWQATEEGEAA